MPPNSEAEDSSIKHKQLVFLLAIAGRIDAQLRIEANKLDNDRLIYHTFAVLDSLSSSYSMFKYFFEVFISPNNDPKLMHHILTSPGGIAAIAAEALFLVGFSFLASFFLGAKDDKENKNSNDEMDNTEKFKKFIATSWPYFRDVMKAVKNAYKGWRVTAQIITLVGGADLKFLVIPLGLALGVLAAANRLWLHKMKEDHKKKKNANKHLLRNIEKYKLLNEETYNIRLEEIQSRTPEERIHAFMSVTAGGVIDGLYLYMGVASLAVFAPPAFLAMVIFSAFYTLTCVVSRVYEEYNNQLELQVTETQCKLALECKRLEIIYAPLHMPDSTLTNEIRELLKKSIADLSKLHLILQSQLSHGYATSFLLGIKYGLAVYGVISAFLFMISSVFVITATAFPPALLMAFIVSGVAVMMIIATHALVTHYLHLKNQRVNPNQSYEALLVMQGQLTDDGKLAAMEPEELREHLDKIINPQVVPQYTFHKVLEILRCFFSGLSKGNNFATFVGTPLQDIDPHGHDHQAPSTMLMLKIASTALFSIVLALRAFAREFGGSKNSKDSKGSIGKNPSTFFASSGTSDQHVTHITPGLGSDRCTS